VASGDNRVATTVKPVDALERRVARTANGWHTHGPQAAKKPPAPIALKQTLNPARKFSQSPDEMGTSSIVL
jgi:hypothetical protein